MDAVKGWVTLSFWLAGAYFVVVNYEGSVAVVQAFGNQWAQMVRTIQGPGRVTG